MSDFVEEAPEDIRMCVALLRDAIRGVTSYPRVDIAPEMACKLMNDTMDVAMKYYCYKDGE